MKKIAVTQRLILNETYYEVREGLDINWGVMFRKLDFLPIVLPVECDFKEYFKILDIDGIILTGGNDLNIIKNNNISQKRDNYEKKLIEYAINNDIPIFGICRGMQIIADFFGSKFYKVDNQIGITHELKLNEQSKYFSSLNKINRVNSFHNYAITTAPKDFLVSARDEKGIIKAIEHKEFKIFAQMWHSERNKPMKNEELALIGKFFNKDNND